MGNFMKNAIIATGIATLLTFTLVGCGGGGGGGDVISNSEKLLITDTNKKEIATSSYGALGYSMLSFSVGLSEMLISSDVLDILAEKGISNRAAPITCENADGRHNVSVDGDKTTHIYVNCKSGTITRDGELTITNESRTKKRIEYNNYKFKGIADGDNIDVKIKEASVNAELGSPDIKKVDVNLKDAYLEYDGQDYTFLNFVHKLDKSVAHKEESSFSGYYKSSSTSDKWLNIKSKSPIIARDDDAIDCPISGELEVVGKDGSKLSAKHQSDGTVRVYVNGDYKATYDCSDFGLPLFD